MSRRIQEIRDKIQDVLDDGVESMAQIIRGGGAPKDRIKAFEALANRGGLPAVSASVSQTLSAQTSPENLLEAKKALQNEQKELATEIMEIKRDLEAPESVVVAEARKINDVLPRPGAIDGEG